MGSCYAVARLTRYVEMSVNDVVFSSQISRSNYIDAWREDTIDMRVSCSVR